MRLACSITLNITHSITQFWFLLYFLGRLFDISQTYQFHHHQSLKDNVVWWLECLTRNQWRTSSSLNPINGQFVFLIRSFIHIAIQVLDGSRNGIQLYLHKQNCLIQNATKIYYYKLIPQGALKSICSNRWNYFLVQKQCGLFVFYFCT